MGNITAFGKTKPGAFRDQLNALMAANKKDYTKVVEKFKKALYKYVKDACESMDEKAVKFEIKGGKVKAPCHGRGESAATICYVCDLPAIKEKFEDEGFTLEWAYDRGEMNGGLIFRW